MTRYANDILVKGAPNVIEVGEEERFVGIEAEGEDIFCVVDVVASDGFDGEGFGVEEFHVIG